MLRIRTASSNNADAALAGKECARKVKDALHDLKLVFVYSGVSYDQQALLKAIGEELPGVPLIGNTSFSGVVTQDGFITGEKGFVGIMALSDADLTVGTAGMAKSGNARETGRKLAEKALAAAGKKEAPAYMYMVAPPGEEEYYLKGVSDVVGRVPLFGGSAADNTLAGEWKLFADKTITGDGAALAFFYTKAAFANKYTGGYSETGKYGVITKIAKERTLVEIDGKPALDQYREWTGASTKDTEGGNLLVRSITNPLGVKDPLGDLIAVRHPMNGNADGSIAVGNSLAVGTAIALLESDTDGLIKAVSTALADLKAKMKGPIAGFHLVHCGGRRIGIGERINELTAAIKKEAGTIPFIVEFTFGEYGYEDDGRNTCGGLMLSFTAFGEK